MRPSQFGIGAPLRRKEDPALLTGQGRFLADRMPVGTAHAVFVRASVAHAHFTLDGLDGARAADGVLDIITGAQTAHLGDLPCIGISANADGSVPPVPPYPILPQKTVRFVGEAVAMVVAETLDQARMAAEMISLATEEIGCVVEPQDALRPDAPVLWPQFGSNLAFDAELGDRAATEAAFAKAARTVSLSLVNNRVVTNYMEPRGAIGEYDAAAGRYTLSASTQGVHLVQPILAERVLGIAKERLRVVTPDVGGGFGTKYFTYPEYALVLLAAERCGRPVSWLADRMEHFLADYHGRDQVSHAELALDDTANFLAIRIDTIANMGAHMGQLGMFIPVNGSGMVPGCYRTPAMHIRVRGAYTNTVPVDAYRGAGRPEAAYLIERLVDKAARETGIAPDALRRRNFVTPAEMPFKTPTQRTYDSGNFDQHMSVAMDQAGWSTFAARRADAAKRGRLRGLGLATYIEACSGGGPESAVVELDESGAATVFIGTQSSGQGHHTAYAQLVSQHLGIDPDRITVVQGDTDRIARGSGTGGSRSIPVGGTSVFRASETLARRIRDKAADRLEAAPRDLEFTAGQVRIAGTDRAVALGEIVATLPPAERRDEQTWQPDAPTFPNGTHVAEVEIDPDTGVIDIVGYTVVDDFGVTLNPVMLEGQIHGGIAQGFGQAVQERTVYDRDSGQLLTATLMDYCLPRADDLAPISFQTRNVPSTTNAMGMKGAGEAGAIGACPALVNAVVDALHAHNGLTHIDMPMTPERVWRALNAKDAG